MPKTPSPAVARLFAIVALVPLLAAGEAEQSLPASTDPGLKARAADADFERREVMIPMRDGVRLKTFVLVPKGASGAPMILDRTPYNASSRTARFESPRLASVVAQMFDTAVAAGYIVVVQDVRGKYGSEGDYVMTRPLRGPYNPTSTDHATDTWDTIDWLVKNVPESNGRVATTGGSYDGFTALMSVIDPHPALKATVPFAPMVDGWMGDDWFHNGAFRQDGALEYTYEQEATRKNEAKWWSGTYDTYEFWLRAGNAGNVAKARGLDALEYWRALSEHTSYDDFWQSQAMDRVLAARPITVPMLIVGGLFDQEDIYGAPALFKALGPKDPDGKKIHLVLGPWNHGGGRRDGRSIADVQFEGETATWFRRTVMQPFLDHYLKDAPDPGTPRVLAYETGANTWQRYDTWPRSCAAGCAAKSRALYLLPGGALGFDKPAEPKLGFDEYLADPAKPVPYRNRPTLASGAEGSTWGEWLMDDQRQAAARPDVLVYETAPLKEPLRVAGEPWARLFASTTGSDVDWVVKVIDVWPEEYPNDPKMGGYQQMISADILRGRFRENFAVPQAVSPNKVLEYRIRLPQANHTFLPGHRIQVQIQSSWFPLYDRNPQTFVPNIMFAPPESYVKATQRIWRTSDQASSIELPIVP